MKYVYSLVRFVPDSARGEFINIGAIAGSDATGEWALRTVTNKKRARYLDERAVLGSVLGVVEELERKLDLSASDSLLPGSENPSEAWLRRLSGEYNNLLQFTAPLPMIADTLESVLDFAFQELILDLASPRRPYKQKGVAVNRTRASYAEVGLGDVIEKAAVRGGLYHDTFDFAVANGKVVQLAQAWSFQLTQYEDLIRDIKAWAWTVRDIRTKGGRASTSASREIDIPSDVDVAAIYIPPEDDAGREALRETSDVMTDVHARLVPLEHVTPDVTVRARELLKMSAQ